MQKRQELSIVNGLYFTTRYPGDESIVIERGKVNITSAEIQKTA